MHNNYKILSDVSLAASLMLLQTDTTAAMVKSRLADTASNMKYENGLSQH